MTAFKEDTGNYTVEVMPSGQYGYFEHNQKGEDDAGGLWFESRNGVPHLIDYDGVFELPQEVGACLGRHGVILADCGYEQDGSFNEGLLK